MLELAKANLAHHSRRYVATILAVAISVAFVSASLVFGGALGRGIKDQVAGDYVGAAAVASVDWSGLSESDAETYPDMNKVAATLADVPGVTEVYSFGSRGFLEASGPSGAWVPVGIIGGAKLHVTTLVDGSLPVGIDEAVVTESAAERLGLQVGSTISLEDDLGQKRSLEIVGVAESARQNLGLNSDDLLVTPQKMAELSPDWEPDEVLVSTDTPTPSTEQQEQLVSAIDAALAENGITGVAVDTGSGAVDEALASVNASQAVLTLMLLLFPIISAVVAMIVVGTTFQVIFRQRERELALLRVIGATGKQARRLMILESMAVGLVGSVLGVGVGIFGGAGIAYALGVVSTYGLALSSVSLTQIIVVVVVSTILTALAGFRPAVRASRVSPVTALAGQIATVAQMSRKQIIVGAISGIATLVLGVLTALRAMRVGDEEQKLADFALVLLGAVLTVTALIIFLSAVLPLITRALGKIGGSEGFRMAAANTGRSPGRTAATGIAIFIGVALISMVTLGAQSLRVTATTQLDASAPVDLVFTAPEGGFTPAQLSAILSAQGVAESAVTPGIPVAVEGEADTQGQTEGLLIEDAELASVVRKEVTTLQDGQVAVASWRFETGDPVTVCIEEECTQLTAVADDVLSNGYNLVVNTQTAQSLGAVLAPMQVWVQLENPDDYQTVISTLTEELGGEVSIEGAVALRAAVDQIVNILVMVVVALLAVSVLVALVGITNTLSLSVAERTKENGLLRALGMTKKQVRSMLSWEALLIAGVATAVGLAAGAYFGIVGFMSLPLGTSNYVIAVPWLQWGVIVVIAVVAALLASIVPGRKASSVSPVEALAAQ